MAGSFKSWFAEGAWSNDKKLGSRVPGNEGFGNTHDLRTLQSIDFYGVKTMKRKSWKPKFFRVWTRFGSYEPPSLWYTPLCFGRDIW